MIAFHIAFNTPIDEHLTKPFRTGRITMLTTQDHATAHGNPMLTLLIDTDDGEQVIASTTLALWQTACAALTGRYGEPH